MPIPYRLSCCIAGRCLIVALAFAPAGALAQDCEPPPGVPGFAELEAAGATIGEIQVVPQDIFDLSDPKENNVMFRFANALHIVTRPGVLRRLVLFRSGEPLSLHAIEETERLMRANQQFYDVCIRPIAWNDGVADIEIRTRDTWSLDPGLSFSRTGGANSTGIGFTEENLLGTGTTIGFTRKSDVDRTGTEFTFGNQHLFGGWTALNYTFSDLDDGESQSLGIARPFYSLDTRWAASAAASTDDRIDSVYSGGVIVGQYRHRQDSAQVSGGWSRGLVEGWTRRYSLGLTYRDDRYELDPARTPPSQLPADQTLVAPFLRYEVIEDHFEKFSNRDLIGRPEYFLTGFSSSAQLGYAFAGFGSTSEQWLYSGQVSNGYEFSGDHVLLLAAAFSGQSGSEDSETQSLGGSASYYGSQGKHTLFYASIALDTVFSADLTNLLLIGGDNGLRGYPLRYQTGKHRALLTVEERLYTDWYPFRLFRIGAAAFLDVGRAWGGDEINRADPGWLANAGFGLRIISARSSSGSVWHIDLAFPISPAPGVDPVQFLVKTRRSF
jgi:outer membrane protein assembly factor BamA